MEFKALGQCDDRAYCNFQGICNSVHNSIKALTPYPTRTTTRNLRFAHVDDS